jgi:glycosyltransferase involved in cell wall biosynthesis
VVIDKAGQREIVRDGEHGFRWSTPEQLADRTVQLAGDPELRARMSAASVQRAQAYSDEAFARRWRDVVDKHALLGHKV